MEDRKIPLKTVIGRVILEQLGEEVVGDILKNRLTPSVVTLFNDERQSLDYCADYVRRRLKEERRDIPIKISANGVGREGYCVDVGDYFYRAIWD